MIKVITFDFYNTLVKFWPPLEEIQQAACRKMGLTVSLEGIRRGYARADILFNRANEEEPLSLRSPERRLEFFAEYEQLILENCRRPGDGEAGEAAMGVGYCRAQGIHPV